MVRRPLSMVARLGGRIAQSAAGSMFEKAMLHNHDIVRDAARASAPTGDLSDFNVLDLGCWDGVNSLAFAPVGSRIHGVEANVDAGLQAKQRGVDVVQADLNDSIPWPDGHFDLVMSNQVIEHVADTDMFVSETFRVLKPGGTAVISTENMASWHNIGALFFGWQAFSLTNVSDRSSGIGNPLALTRDWDAGGDKGWQHIRIFSYQGLRELFEVHGFAPVRVEGAGYYPLPTAVAKLDARHAAFITAIATKPSSS